MTVEGPAAPPVGGPGSGEAGLAAPGWVCALSLRVSPAPPSPIEVHASPSAPRGPPRPPLPPRSCRRLLAAARPAQRRRPRGRPGRAPGPRERL